MASSATVFAVLPELVGCLAENTRSRKQLATLRLVNKTFCDAATPYFYREAEPVTVGDIAELAEKDDILRHVQDLSIRLQVNVCDADRELQRLLPKLPALKVLCCRTPLSPETYQSLGRWCPRIKTLRFDFRTLPWRGTPEAWRHNLPDLTVFSDLDDLKLMDIYDDLPWWRNHIADMLKNSPSLKHLELSLSTATMDRLSDNMEYAVYWGWFDQLAKTYSDIGGQPLRLRSLRCGSGVYPQSTIALERLLDMNYVKEVHIWNELVGTGRAHDISCNTPGWSSPSGAMIAFDHLVSAPNLRRFSVAWYDVNVHRALCTMQNPEKMRNVYLTAAHSGRGYEPAALLRPDDRYRSLPMHPRVLEIELDRSNVYLKDDRSDEPDRLLETPDAETVLQTLIEGDEGACQGLVLCLPNMAEHTPGKLEESIELLERYLPHLVKLRELCVLAGGYEVKIENPIAERLALAIPSLRYIQVRLRGSSTFMDYHRIHRAGDGTVSLEVLKGDATEVVELHDRTSVWTFRANWDSDDDDL